MNSKNALKAAAVAAAVRMFAAALVLSTSWFLAQPSVAQNFSVLHHFTGTDGGSPKAGLVTSGSVLYGTIDDDSLGTHAIFRINQDGSQYSLVYTWSESGNDPGEGLVLLDGVLYGSQTTGNYLYRVQTNGSNYQQFYQWFMGTGDQGGPWGDLLSVNQKIYGITMFGGAYSQGAVYCINPDGTDYQILTSFGPIGPGIDPFAGLTLSGPTLYGTTYLTTMLAQGGTVFSVDTNGLNYSVLHVFTGDNVHPSTRTAVSGSTLYGTVGGIIYKMGTDGSDFTVMRRFSAEEGASGGNLLISGGKMYGTTAGADTTNVGVVFTMNLDGTGFAILKRFGGIDGANPRPNLLLAGNALYGMTVNGGQYGRGVVFSVPLVPPGIVQGPITQTAELGSNAGFRVVANGSQPMSYQWYFNGTNLLSSATNSELRLSGLQFNQGGAYSVMVSNQFGSTNSPGAMLSVIAAVDRRMVPGLVLMGAVGSSLGVEFADSLDAPLGWLPLDSVTLTTIPQYYFDLTQPLPPQRYYRLKGGGGHAPPVLNLYLVPAITLTGNAGDHLRLDYINQFGPTDAWVPLNTVTLTNSTQLYFDISSPGQPQRLYRIVSPP
jgi:uncharacterized repeat protein (TIGR03803 family)